MRLSRQDLNGVNEHRPPGIPLGQFPLPACIFGFQAREPCGKIALPLRTDSYLPFIKSQVY